MYTVKITCSTYGFGSFCVILNKLALSLERMPWYKITIYPRTGRPSTGARLIDLENEDKVRAYIWNQAREVLGRWNIDHIEFAEVPATDPLVYVAIMKKARVIEDEKRKNK
jgi:hypothetical protein